MAKIMIDCADPNDFAAVVESAENAAGSCTITYAKQHLEMVKAGTSKSQRESSRIIAKDSSESEHAVRDKIRRGLKEMEEVPPQESKTPDNQEPTREAPPEKFDSGRGGHREGAGRKPKIYEVTEAMQFAIMAQANLERIRSDDPEREKALIHIRDWITAELEEE